MGWRENKGPEIGANGAVTGVREGCLYCSCLYQSEQSRIKGKISDVLTKEYMYRGEILRRSEGVKSRAPGRRGRRVQLRGRGGWAEGSTEEAQEDRGEAWPSGLLRLPGMMAQGGVVSRTQSEVLKS